MRQHSWLQYIQMTVCLETQFKIFLQPKQYLFGFFHVQTESKMLLKLYCTSWPGQARFVKNNKIWPKLINFVNNSTERKKSRKTNFPANNFSNSTYNFKQRKKSFKPLQLLNILGVRLWWKQSWISRCKIALGKQESERNTLKISHCNMQLIGEFSVFWIHLQI